MSKEFDWELNLRQRYPSGRCWSAVNEVQSFWARLSNTYTTQTYGSSPGQQLDIFPAAQANAPVLFFIHGGYFRALDKRSYSFIAASYVELGYTVVLVNYDLCPKVRVTDICQQVIKSFAWVQHNIHQYNGDKNSIILCGHSVGAFLVSKLLRRLWSQDMSSIKLAVLLSGIYDLEPLRNSYLNASLHLSANDVDELGEMQALSCTSVPLVVAVGAEETDEFIRQSLHYSKLDHNTDCYFLSLDGLNHYTVARSFAQTNSALQQKLLQVAHFG